MVTKTNKPLKAALYARVSTGGQTTENQLKELREAAQRLGWLVVAEYVDQGISGAKGREGRPQLDALLKGVARKEFDVVAAWSVDRLGRSLIDLVGLLKELHATSIDLYLHQQAINTTTPAGRAMFQMMGVFAEFEREMIKERVKAGLGRARAAAEAKGELFAIGRPKVTAATEEHIRQLRSKGMGMLRIAKAAGCGVSAVQRVLANAAV